MRAVQEVTPDEILSFWFPRDLDRADLETIRAFWDSRMHGGMDEAICRDYADLTLAGAEGRLDHWAETAQGRLALILVLDQFPRSLWRDTPKCYGQDIKSCRLALDGIANGHYEALTSMQERQFYIICIAHCEGPDHLERMDLCIWLNKGFLKIARAGQEEMVERAVAQARRIRGIIECFGRHPHRNAILGRVSTPEELAYVEAGEFPHLANNTPGQG